MKQLLFLFFGFSIYGQQLHHQMLSSQGSSNLLSTGIRINQTIGQQSVIGNYAFSKSVVGQGFQQSSIAKSGASFVPDAITTLTYPNPFIDQIITPRITYILSQLLRCINHNHWYTNSFRWPCIGILWLQ